jgi:hypothetical protein
LANGEIGVETDTNQFKLGDGVNVWSDLSYFKNLDDLAGSLDDYVLLSTKGQPSGVAELDSDGHVPLSQLANLVASAPQALDTLNELSAALGNDANFATTILAAVGTKVSSSTFTTHTGATTSVHGIADTSVLATATTVATAKSEAISAAATYTSTAKSEAITAAATDATNKATAAAAEAATDATTKAATAKSEAITAAASAADTKISTHNSATTNVHGISDTSALATKTYADGAVSTAVAALTKSSVGLGNVNNTADSEKPVSTATQTALDLKANLAGPTFTGTVSGITKSMVGLGSVDNTTDLGKPVSTATQTALDLKAPKAAPTFTGTLTAADVTISGNLTVSGTTTTVNTTNFTTSDPVIYLGEGNNANLVDIGFVGSYNDGTYAHQGLVKDSSDSKWKLFKGVTDEPTTTVNFSQGSLDALKVGAFEATTVTPSSGVVFSDGTQTKEGVVSRTPIVQKTASYTLSALTERDSLIEVSSASAVTLTIPTNATLALPVGTSIDILQTGAGQITVAGAAGVTVNATPGLKLRTQWSGATLFKRATDTWVVYGDLSA